MNPTPNEPVLAFLRGVVSTALKQWLDENRGEFFRVVREAMIDNERNRREQQHTKTGEFLTVAEVALRWHLNRETVRRMIRDGRIPSVLAGRYHRVARTTVEVVEKSGSLRCR